MEPIKITAVSGPDGTHVEAFDAADLFEQAGKALSEKRYDDAIRGYDRVLEGVQATSRYTIASIYNAGLAHQGKKDWEGAIARFKTLGRDPWGIRRRQGLPVPAGRDLCGDEQLARFGADVRPDPGRART